MKDLKDSTEKIKNIGASVMAKARPQPRRTGPLWFIAGLAGGVAAFYFLDGQRGAARRQMVIDRITSTGNDIVEQGTQKARHWRNQAAGTVAEHAPDRDVAENL